MRLRNEILACNITLESIISINQFLIRVLPSEVLQLKCTTLNSASTNATLPHDGGAILCRVQQISYPGAPANVPHAANSLYLYLMSVGLHKTESSSYIGLDWQNPSSVHFKAIRFFSKPTVQTPRQYFLLLSIMLVLLLA